jgi:hypothetical protein
MKRTIITIILLALLAAACGTDEGADTTVTTQPPGTTAAPDGPARMLLMVSNEGGFVPLEIALNQAPSYTLLTDGTLIFQGPVPAIFPGPLLPNFQQVKLSADQMDDIQVLIDAIGLSEFTDYVNDDANNFVADANTTVATYVDDAGVAHRMSVYALGIQQEMPDELANLMLLTEKLDSFTYEGPAGEPFVSDRFIVRILEGGSFDPQFEDVRPWEFGFEPGPVPIQMPDVPCQVLDGEAATAARAMLGDASQVTQWEHATGTFTVVARDLLPGEGGCEPR